MLAVMQYLATEDTVLSVNALGWSVLDSGSSRHIHPSAVVTDADHTKLNNAGTQSVVTTAPTSASGFANGHVWYVVS